LQAFAGSVAAMKITTSEKPLLKSFKAMLLKSKAQLESFQPSIQKLELNELFNYFIYTFCLIETVAIRLLLKI